MINDLVQTVINDSVGYYTCWNCELSYCMHYTNKNKICSGVVKSVDIDVPFDVIRLCIKTSNEGIQTFDYTPDEVSSVITVLSHSMGDWLSNSPSYQRFRNRCTDHPSPV